MSAVVVQQQQLARGERQEQGSKVGYMNDGSHTGGGRQVRADLMQVYCAQELQ